jgi:ribonuclease BN (tRNA processing enzyme)
MKIIFLGTGGGRHMMSSQVRKTGGMFFDMDDVRFILDPGPGSLVNARSVKLTPEKWDGILLSHLHIDHCTDANVYIDCMKEPVVVAGESCIVPKKGRSYPCITQHHQKMAKVLKPMKHKDTAMIGPAQVTAYESKHYDSVVGFRIKHPKITIGYPSDGIYYAGQEKFYEGCDVLILNILIPKGMEPDRKVHMSIDDAIRLVRAMEKKPRLIFSFWMFQNNISKQAKILQDATKVPVIHAEDFMEIDLSTMKSRILKPA